MRQRVAEFIAGLVFGLGLILSGMTDPGKVQGFLDLAGDWDPSLALVMGGAILVGVLAFALARRRATALLGGAMQLPTAWASTTGWWPQPGVRRRLGAGGLLPGAGAGRLGAGHWQALVFVLAMLAGMAVHDLGGRFATSE
jgi:hypothetical protein